MTASATADTPETMAPQTAKAVAAHGASAKIRIDKWLWHARFFKTRSLAAKLVDGGHCRVNRDRIRKPGHTIKPGDVLTFPQGRNIRVIEVLAISDRRGPAPEARLLYNDLDPPVTAGGEEASEEKALEAAGLPLREPGSGRPTKKDRRQMDTLRARG